MNTCHECGRPARYTIYGLGWCTNHRGLAEAHRPPLPGSAHAEHSRSCAIFTGGHDVQGVFRPVECDCGGRS